MTQALSPRGASAAAQHNWQTLQVLPCGRVPDQVLHVLPLDTALLQTNNCQSLPGSSMVQCKAV